MNRIALELGLDLAMILYSNAGARCCHCVFLKGFQVEVDSRVKFFLELLCYGKFFFEMESCNRLVWVTEGAMALSCKFQYVLIRIVSCDTPFAYNPRLPQTLNNSSFLKSLNHFLY